MNCQQGFMSHLVHVASVDLLFRGSNQTLKLYQNEHNDELIVISLFSCCPQVTVVSKFLTFQESMRDSADLYLSLRYPPPVFICGTPCGFVGHVNCKKMCQKCCGTSTGVVLKNQYMEKCQHRYWLGLLPSLCYIIYNYAT